MLIRSKHCTILTQKTLVSMGIGWTVAHRAVVLGGDIVCGSGDSKSTADAVVADGPAVFRRLMLRPQTAVTVARTFVRQLVARAPSRSLDGVVVSILFDDAAKMPPQRALVAASRARANPADPAGARLDPHTLTPGHLAMVLNWDPLLAHSGSKKAVWELLGRAVFEQLCGHDGCIAEVVTAGAAYTRDNDGVLPTRTPTMHGEADLLVATRAAELATVGRAVEIVTVDYDQVLQALVAPPLTSGPSVLRFRAETIDVAQLVAAYGGECRSRRLSAAFFMLCAFRSDYSKSLCRPTGSRVAAFATAMADGVVAVAERTDAATGARTLTFRPPSFLGVIKAWPQGVGHQTTTAMLEAVLWTLAYFAGYDAFRPAWGGPPCIQLEPAGCDVHWTQNAEIDFLHEAHVYQPDDGSSF